jgi:FkbM family methyltransferase
MEVRLLREMIRSALFMCPTYRGGVKVAQSRLCRRLTARDELLPARLWGGGEVYVNINDYDGRSLYFWGANDRKITWLCQHLLRPGDTMLDIGANYGSVGISAARSVGAAGRVHCFEPQPQLAQAIRLSARRNGLSNVTVHEVALSDRDGTCDFSVPRGHSGRGSLCSAQNAEGQRLRVTVRHAGDYLRNLDLCAVRLIKLDVESHEEAVLRGTVDLMRAIRPFAIVFELHDDGRPFFERGAVVFLKEQGYQFLQVRQRPLFSVELKPIENNAAVETGYDFVALDRLGPE